MPVRDLILVVYLFIYVTKKGTPCQMNVSYMITSLDNYFVKHISEAASN